MRSSRPAGRVFLLFALAALSGCLELGATLDAEGGGEMSLVARDISAEQNASIVHSLDSPTVKLLEQRFEGGTGTYRIAFADVERLRSAPFFRNTRIKRTRAGRRETLVVTLQRTAPPPRQPDKASSDEAAFTLHLTVPGAIVDSNADSVEGSTAAWRFKERTLIGKGAVGMKVVYDLPEPTPLPTAAATAAVSPTAAATSTRD